MKNLALTTTLIAFSCFSLQINAQSMTDGEPLQDETNNPMTRRAIVSSVINGFDRMDSDNNGVLSIGEMEKGKAIAFEALDTVLNQNTYVGDLRIDEVKENISSGFEQFDQNLDGIVTSIELDAAKRDVVSIIKRMFPKVESEGELSRAEKKVERLAAAVAAGKISQEDADSITDGHASIRAIKEQVREGSLTKEEAKAQINGVKETMPSKAKRSQKRSRKDKIDNNR